LFYTNIILKTETENALKNSATHVIWQSLVPGQILDWIIHFCYWKCMEK
jgi:hypothetical protein